MTRSNRKSTQKVIEDLNRFLAEGQSGRERLAFSTIDTRIEASKGRYLIRFHDQPIMALDRHPQSPEKLTKILCTTGFYYNSIGVPSIETRERLNGLLDYLGDRGYIPRGVRVFVDREGCWIGKDGECVGLDKDFPVVTIEVSPHTLVMS